ncbi:transient receptor potential cation channel subfamily A member 1-like [Diadema antillarum]|uniref:transient receptor potential cation channel subfamily A member 1-like n=1 Tax=Diadema antillarum TaxID=105358 RepID=UPI003A89A6E6
MAAREQPLGAEDNWNESWLHSGLSNIDQSVWLDGLEGDSPPGQARSSSPNKKKKEKARKSIVQLASAGQLVKLKAQLDELDKDDVNRKINEHDGENYSALHYAAESDNVEMVRLLVNRGGDANDIGKASRRPLHFAAAARKGRDQTKSGEGDRLPKTPGDNVISILLNGGAKINAEDKKGRTPLHIAAFHGNVETASRLLESEDIDIEAKDQRSITPLLTACIDGKTDVALMLIDKDAKLNVWDENFDTPLHFAFREGNKEVSRRIIEKGKQENCLYKLLTETNQDIVAPIHEAVRYGHEDLVLLALELVKTDEHNEIDKKLINFCGENEVTPLHEACRFGRLEMVEMLCEKGARINVQDWDGLSPLHFACANNHRKVADYLIGKGADISLTDYEDLTPLQTAANSNNFDTLVALLYYLHNLNMTTLDQDSHNAAEKLLTWAAEQNKADTLQLILHQCRSLHGISDECIAEYIHHASKNGHTETVSVLYRWKRDVVEVCDVDDNTPLHHAAKAGHDETVDALIKAKVEVNTPNGKEEYERTPLHYAAANGWIRTVNLLLEAEADINAVDKLQMTPLHLACKTGYIDMVKLLVYNEQTDILLRDIDGLNCLDHAIENRHDDIANFFVRHDKWKELMSVCTWDSEKKKRKTPMRQLIKHMPEIAKQVMDRCITHNPEVEPNHPDYWVEFDYELLEDSFSNWEKPVNLDGEDGNEEEKEENDQCDAYGIEADDAIGNGEHRETSFTNQPNGKTTSKETDDEVKKTNSVPDDKESTPTTTDQYDSEGHLRDDATPYTTDFKDIARNHPLNIMVSAERTNLLTHPLVTSLINLKWIKAGRLLVVVSLVFCIPLVVMLTGYVLVIPPTYYVRFANGTDGVTWFANGEDRWVGEFSEATLFFFGRIGNWVILVLAVFNLIRELFQLYFQRRSYFASLCNLIEWALYVLAILLVLPLSQIRYHSGIRIPLAWQWQCGAVAVFLAWINLILYIRRFSVLGIYVIMFTEILRTFMQFVLILVLVLVAFALAFYTLLMNQEPFHRIEYSLAKTFVMMIGELDFGDIFHSQNYLNTENTLTDGEEEYFLSSVFYQSITYVIFALFLVVMPILIMNLLIGLAVGDIQAIQEKAEFTRLEMQVEFVMEILETLPLVFWRSAVRRRKRFFLQKWYRALTGDKNVLCRASKICIKNQHDQARGELRPRATATTDQLLPDMKYRLKQIDSKVETIGGTVNDELVKQADELAKQADKQEKQSDELTKQSNELAKQSDVLTKQSNELGKHSDELTKQSNELTKQSDELTKHSDELAKQSDELTKQSNELGKHFDELTKQSNELAKQSDVLTKQSNELGKHSDELTKQSNELTKQSDELTKHSDELAKQSDELTKQSDELGKHSDELTKQSNELAKQSDELTKQSDELAKQSGELAKQSYELAKQANELSGIKDRFDRIENKIDELLKYIHDSRSKSEEES